MARKCSRITQEHTHCLASAIPGLHLQIRSDPGDSHSSSQRSTFVDESNESQRAKNNFRKEVVTALIPPPPHPHLSTGMDCQ